MKWVIFIKETSLCPSTGVPCFKYPEFRLPYDGQLRRFQSPFLTMAATGLDWQRYVGESETLWGARLLHIFRVSTPQ